MIRSVTAMQSPPTRIAKPSWPPFRGQDHSKIRCLGRLCVRRRVFVRTFLSVCLGRNRVDLLPLFQLFCFFCFFSPIALRPCKAVIRSEGHQPCPFAV